MSDQDTRSSPHRTVGNVEVQIGPAFLRLFSEQMYSSPNKAFEELVSNSWDAGATSIHIWTSNSLRDPNAGVWVLDNGESMDFNGLKQLWSVASSDKPTRDTSRPQIGKFGIGKLATYVLADELTYVCKAQDGRILSVTMDYRRIGDAGSGLHIDPLPLEVIEIPEESLEDHLYHHPGGAMASELISQGVPTPTPDDLEDEFGGESEQDVDPDSSTWTLALLTNLRPAGREMQVGHVKRMLRAALPLGSTVSIVFDNEPLRSSKLNKKITQDWILGPELDLTHFAISDDEEIQVSSSDTPFPHITVQGIPGRITGTVRLFSERISGGKSEQIAPSNGFKVNILGRVVNADDPYFGLENLNHSAWSRFRAAIRADGLNDSLAVSREDVIETHEVRIFRHLLKVLFNRARTAADSARRSEWPSAGQVLEDRLGSVPLEPLRRLPRTGSRSGGRLPSVVDTQDVANVEDAVNQLAEAEAPLDGVIFRDLEPEGTLAQLDLSTRRLVINSSHPFALEHAATHEQQVLLRDYALADFLTHLYLGDLGVPVDNLDEAAEYRDQMLRLLARVQRRSAITLRDMLDLVLSEAKPLEHVVGDALESLGFVVRRMGGSGEPEGVAHAPVSRKKPTESTAYSFTYDAKSTTKPTQRVANNDVKVSTLVRHRKDNRADHTLVVAPDFEAGALENECRNGRVTPMRASDLAQLLMVNATLGPLDTEALRGLFDHYSPDDVSSFVSSLSDQSTQRVRYDDFFDTLREIGYEEPDILTTSVIAREMRKKSGDQEFPDKIDVEKLISGLTIIAPQLIRTSGERVFVSARPDKIRDAVLDSMARAPEEYRQRLGIATQST